ncbi:MAG: ABC transporter ATP-binding protein [Bryobacteraceae bacterium]|nr:ABC transporter ATP-binding protein [Bryobacteraceae bacterium]MDW8377412.1 ABC transporter ATP-binding protein [Bryobacterales bacterium]
MQGELAVEIRGLRKSFGQYHALCGLDLSVPKGSICGFLGRNGAGKTTTFKVLLGAIRADAGQARVFGLSCSERWESLEIRRRTGFVSEQKCLYPYMTVEEVLRFTRPFFPHWDLELEKSYLERFEIDSKLKIPKLSKGYLTKLNLVLALCRRADLLLLDEPTEGLDPAVVEDVLQALVNVNAEFGTTIFFSSHQLHEIEQIADRVVIIDGGRTLLEDSLDDLRAAYRRLNFVFDENPRQAESRLRCYGPLLCEGRSVSLLVKADWEAAAAEARALGARLLDAQPVSLKEIFLRSLKGK